MTIEQRAMNGVTIFDIQGDMMIDTMEDMALFKTVRSLLQEGRTRFLVNLQGVQRIDTMGLCNIVEAFITTQRKGGMLKLAGINPHVRKVLETTKLLAVFEVYDSVSTALASFAARS